MKMWEKFSIAFFHPFLIERRTRKFAQPRNEKRLGALNVAAISTGH
jgi:hypothetical protein